MPLVSLATQIVFANAFAGTAASRFQRYEIRLAYGVPCLPSYAQRFSALGAAAVRCVGFDV